MAKTRRSRVLDQLTPMNYTYSTYKYATDTTTVHTSGPLTADQFQLGSYKSMEDISTSNYRRRSASGEVVISPMYKHEREREYDAGGEFIIETLDSSGNPNERKIRSFNPYYSSSSSAGLPICAHLTEYIDIGQLKTLAGTAAQANIQEPEFSGLVFLGELRETVTFLLSPLRGWQRWVKRQERKARWRKRRKPKTLPKHVRTVADFISNGWLSYRYGAMPLVYDMHDAASAISAIDLSGMRQTARGFAINEDEHSQDFVQANTWGTLSKTANSKRTVKVRSGILYEADFSDTFGMRLEQLPIAVYELIPFSFVNDWFNNLGDYIQAITPKAGIKVLGSWTVVDDRYTTTERGITTTGTKPETYPYVSGSPYNGRLYDRYVTRTTDHAVGIASRPLPYSGDIGLKRVADTIALTQSILSSKL